MITTKEELIVKLRSINACESAIDYIDGQPDLQTAWENCRPSYLWWLVRHTVKLTPQQSVEFAKVSAVYAKFVAERAAERAAEWAAEWAAHENGVMTPREYINSRWSMEQVLEELDNI